MLLKNLLNRVRRIAAIARVCKTRVLTDYGGSSPPAPTSIKLSDFSPSELSKARI